jgi:hypothetical protein
MRSLLDRSRGIPKCSAVQCCRVQGRVVERAWIYEFALERRECTQGGPGRELLVSLAKVLRAWDDGQDPQACETGIGISYAR